MPAVKTLIVGPDLDLAHLLGVALTEADISLSHHAILPRELDPNSLRTLAPDVLLVTGFMDSPELWDVVADLGDQGILKNIVVIGLSGDHSKVSLGSPYIKVLNKYEALGKDPSQDACRLVHILDQELAHVAARSAQC